MAALDCGVASVIAILVSIYLGLDVVLLNTSAVFVTGQPLNVLRSNVFTMVGYASLALAFSPLWLKLDCLPRTQPDLFNNAAVNRSLDAFYQSVRTLTTAGPEGTLSGGAKLLASGESLVGIYFLSIIIAGYLSLVKKDGDT